MQPYHVYDKNHSSKSMGGISLMFVISGVITIGAALCYACYCDSQPLPADFVLPTESVFAARRALNWVNPDSNFIIVAACVAAVAQVVAGVLFDRRR